MMGAQDFTKKDPHLKKYMRIYLSKIMTVTSIMLILDGSGEALAKKDDIWTYLKEHAPEDYKALRGGLFGIAMNLPGRGEGNSQSEHTVQRGDLWDSTKRNPIRISFHNNTQPLRLASKVTVS